MYYYIFIEEIVCVYDGGTWRGEPKLLIPGILHQVFVEMLRAILSQLQGVRDWGGESWREGDQRFLYQTKEEIVLRP